MKPRGRRKLFSSLRQRCRGQGIQLELDPDAGAGSHGSLVFYINGASPIRLVVAYSREITPGVQRSILKYLEGQGHTLDSQVDRDFARALLNVFTKCLEE
jgi:hypothetical protein